MSIAPPRFASARLLRLSLADDSTHAIGLPLCWDGGERGGGGQDGNGPRLDD
ncbi:MAG: hypothetical protein KF777_00990 [Planctomycetaceae bacterium]|nr:hypothetical protein [Planctomycetaceae bacterium]